MRQAIVIAAAALGLAGCGLFETPCGRVAASICTIPSESDSCSFLKSVKSENSLAQDACKDLEPAAKSYAQDPSSVTLKAKWFTAKMGLSVLGYFGDKLPNKPADKLEKAKEQAGEALQNAGEAVRDAVKDAAK